MVHQNMARIWLQILFVGFKTCQNVTLVYHFEPRHEKKMFLPYANNKGADQTAHPCSLISTFVFRCLDSIISLVSIFEMSSL